VAGAIFGTLETLPSAANILAWLLAWWDRAFLARGASTRPEKRVYRQIVRRPGELRLGAMASGFVFDGDLGDFDEQSEKVGRGPCSPGGAGRRRPEGE
jgi:hypothetical protein